MEEVIELAQRAVESFCERGDIIDPPANLPDRLLNDRQGVFVTLKKEGDLRGCMGTFRPTQENIAEEIITNAISAAFRDPRFPPVRSEELNDLQYEISLLSVPEPVEDTAELDPKKYGVIAEKGSSRGLLLPDLEGLDTVEQQLAALHRKAGLPPGEPDVDYKKFTVQKFTGK